MIEDQEEDSDSWEGEEWGTADRHIWAVAVPRHTPNPRNRKPGPEPKRHSFLQEEARMLSPIFQAAGEVGGKWRQEALCKQVVRENPEMMEDWFAPDGTHQSKNAVDICFLCPVRLECLKWASVSKQKHGVWGGMPESLRMPTSAKDGRYRPHSFEDLSEQPNPYETDNTRSRFHQLRLFHWDGNEYLD